MRRAAPFLLVLSLITCVGAMIMGARSLFIYDGLRITRPRHVVSIASFDGRFLLVFTTLRGERPASFYTSIPSGFYKLDRSVAHKALAFDVFNAAKHHEVGDFGYMSIPYPGMQKTRIFVPWWSIALLTSIAPLRRAFALRAERKRRRARLCHKCGYDLRATPDADGPLLSLCPECGAQRKSISAIATVYPIAH